MDVSPKGNMPRFSRTGKGVQTSLREIANKAKREPEYRFRNLYGMIDTELLKHAWRSLNKKAVAGVDQVTAEEYGRDLEANLCDLVERLMRDGYRAKLVKRKLIPKGNGKTRALGIPVLEDRLLQRAVKMILEAVFEPIFLNCSYGYREGRGAKMAVKDLRDALQFDGYTTVLDADIKGFFDNLDHDQLVEMLEKKINDRKLIRLIRKWLNAGILDTDGMVINPLTGTPQGGIVSPMLSNIYLHYVLDQWIEEVVKPRMSGPVKYVRYADDFVCAFSSPKDAERFRAVLPKRLEKYSLKLAEDKTHLINFERWGGKKRGRFDFLGYELYWGKSRKGMPNVKRRTSRKRLRRAVNEMSEWVKENRSRKLRELIGDLNAKLRGHYEYYGVIGNYESLAQFYYQVNKILFKWLNRRSQKKSMTWFEFQVRVQKRLMNPRVMEQRVLQRQLRGIRC